MLSTTKPGAVTAVQVGSGGGGGGGGGSAGACSLTDTYPDTTVGSQGTVREYYFQNQTAGPLKITSVVLTTDHPELWKLGGTVVPGLVVLQGDIATVDLTFNPPAK